MIRDTTQRDEFQMEMQAAPSRTEGIETRHKDPAQVIAFTIKPVAEVAEKLPIEPIGAPSTPPTSEPVCDDVSHADLSLSEDARTTSKKDQRHDKSTTTTAGDLPTTEAESTTTGIELTTTTGEVTTTATESTNTTTEPTTIATESTTTAGESTTSAAKTASTETESVEREPLPELDVPPSAAESMDISYEDISDSDLPGAECDSEYEKDETGLDDAIQMENYKGNVEIMFRSIHSERQR